MNKALPDLVPSRWLARALSMVAALSLGWLASACDSDGDHRSVTRLADPSDLAHEDAPRISEELMLALAQAKNFHHRAKVFMADGNPTEAKSSVRRILSLRFPPNAPEAEDVRADARALLAKLMMGAQELDEAARVVDEGLADSTRDSFFVANLYTVKGELHEAMAKAAAAQGPGNEATATEHRREAIRAFDRAIAINAAIQRRLVERGAP